MKPRGVGAFGLLATAFIALKRWRFPMYPLGHLGMQHARVQVRTSSRPGSAGDKRARAQFAAMRGQEEEDGHSIRHKLDGDPWGAAVCSTRHGALSVLWVPGGGE